MARLTCTVLLSTVVLAFTSGSLAASSGPGCARRLQGQSACAAECTKNWGWPGRRLGTDRWGSVVEVTVTDFADNSVVTKQCRLRPESVSPTPTPSVPIINVASEISLTSSSVPTSSVKAFTNSTTPSSTRISTSTRRSSSVTPSSTRISSSATPTSSPPPPPPPTTTSTPPPETTPSPTPTPTPQPTTEKEPEPTTTEAPKPIQNVATGGSNNKDKSNDNNSGNANNNSNNNNSNNNNNSGNQNSGNTNNSGNSSNNNNNSGNTSNSGNSNTANNNSGGGSATSGSDIEQYLSAHNSFRAQHGASPLTWSDEAAAKAQTWANNCKFQHSGGTLGPFGENLAAGTGASYGIAEAIKSWTDEVSEYDPNNPQPSHFTQVVWKGTSQVGCAVQLCDGIFASSFGKAKYFVCEYSAQGNIIGAFAQNVQK